MAAKEAQKAQEQPKRYRVTRPEGYEGDSFGLRYPGPDGEEKHAKEGQVVSDLPHSSVHWLLEDGMIEEVKAKHGAPEGSDQ